MAKPIDIDDLTRTVARTLRTSPPTGRLRVALGPMRSRAAATLAAAFEAGGHAVFTANDAWGLVRCADQNEADVAVIEALNGDTTVAFLRGHAVTRRLPLVLLADRRGSEPAGVGCTPVAPEVADADLVRATERAVRQPSN